MNTATVSQPETRTALDDMPHLKANEHLMSSMSVGKYIRNLYQKSGFDVNSWYEDYGVGAEKFGRAEGRFPHEVTSIIWNKVERVSRDRDIGLHLAENASFPSNHLLYYLTSSSDTLRTALQQMVDYCQLLSDACQIKLVEEGRRVKLVIDLHHLSIPATRQQMEFWISVYINHMAFLSGGDFYPVKLRFKHDRPVSLSEHNRLFNCGVMFGQEENSILFDAEFLDLPVLGSNTDVFRLLKGQADSTLSSLNNSSIVERVRNNFVKIINDGRSLDKDINVIASSFNMSPRTLQRKLAAENASFNQILDDYKKEVTLEKMINTGRSIADIGCSLGYADISTFYRAFKRWTGVTPSQYREKNRA